MFQTIFGRILLIILSTLKYCTAIITALRVYTCTTREPETRGSPSVLRLGNMLSLRVESLVRVRGVVHDVQLPVLVIVAVPAENIHEFYTIISLSLLPSMHHTITVPFLVSELSVVPINIEDNFIS